MNGKTLPQLGSELGFPAAELSHLLYSPLFRSVVCLLALEGHPEAEGVLPLLPARIQADLFAAGLRLRKHRKAYRRACRLFLLGRLQRHQLVPLDVTLLAQVSPALVALAICDCLVPPLASCGVLDISEA